MVDDATTDARRMFLANGLDPLLVDQLLSKGRVTPEELRASQESRLPIPPSAEDDDKTYANCKPRFPYSGPFRGFND